MQLVLILCKLQLLLMEAEISRTSYGKGSPIKLYMYAIDATDWEETFDFGAEREAFDRGELLLLCFPDKRNPMRTKEEPILPKGEIQILTYAGELYENHGKGDPIAPKPPLIFASKPVPVSVQWVSSDVPRRQLAMNAPYTVVCSNTYLEKLLSTFEHGDKWQWFTAGEDIGYMNCRVFADRNADDFSTDKVLSQFCKRNGLGMDNRRQEYMAHIQENLQELILLYFSGISIALMALLICFAALALETEQEKRYFHTMRIIGMSTNQMKIRTISKAFCRSCITLFIGWINYFGYVIAMEMKEGIGFWDAIYGAVPYLTLRLEATNTDYSYVMMSSLICLLIPFVLFLFTKHKLRKENMLS